MWGPPNELERHPKGLLGPYADEAWYYNYIPGTGTNVRMTFIDRTGNGEYQIASEPFVLRILFRLGISVPGIPSMQPILLRRLENIALYVGQAWTPKKRDEAKEVIEQEYRQRGVAVRVDEQVSAVPPAYVALTFVISRR